MSLRIRRGTDSQRQGITPLEGELIYATDTKKLYVGDGSTGGGIVVDSSAGSSNLNDLANVTAPSPNVNDIIKWNGSAWITAAQNAASVLNDLTNVNASPKINDGLVWNGTTWVAGQPFGDGSDLNVNIIGDDSVNIINSATRTVTALTVTANLVGDLFAEDGVSKIVSNGAFLGQAQFIGDITGNLIGSVYADNSTRIIDGNTGDITGDLNGKLIGDVFASNKSSRILDHGTDGTDAVFIGSLTGNSVGIHTGSVIGSVDGDLTGSVFADDSSVLIDGVLGAVTGQINTNQKIRQTMNGTSGVDITGITAGSAGPNLKYSAARGTVTAPVILQASDTILNVVANGYDGGDFETPAVVMRLGVDKYTSAVASNVMPGRFVVLTHNESGTTGLDNALVFNRFGRLAIGDDNPTEKLDVRGNIKATGSYIGGVQAISGAGAIDVTTLHTEITTTSTDAYTLANGVAGQLKIISMKVDGGDGTLTPTTLATGTTITFNDVNDSVTMIYSSLGWLPIAVQGATVA